MRKIPFEVFQAEKKNIFLEINKKFQSENIFWFAHSGTLLGAKRNGKLIPWDDDIDMSMTPKDFKDNRDKIYQICKESNLIVAEKKDYLALNVTRFISKERVIVVYEGMEYITSVFIDVMLSVPVKRKSLTQRWFWYITNKTEWIFNSFWKPLPKYKIKNGSPKKINFFEHLATWIGRILIFPLILLPYWEKRTLRNAEKSNSGLLLMHYGWSHDDIYYKYKEFEKVELENSYVWISKNWEYDLKYRYGNNWRELPPEEKRRPHHITITPYREGKDEYKIYPYIFK